MLTFFVVGELGERVGEPVWEWVGDWASVSEEELITWAWSSQTWRKSEGGVE